jgi:acyl carrier protein
LAEATLLAAGGDGPQEPKILTVDRESLGEGQAKVVNDDQSRGHQKLVGCGGASHQTELLVVDPKTCSVVDQRVVGEIWLKGASISDGYWNRDQENQEQFSAVLSRSDQEVAGILDQQVPADCETGYCRTGDLGFMHDGHLYVTGRIKDVIILRGRNLFPQDIEATVRDTMGNECGQCAAFAVEGARGEALAVVAELPRRADESTLPELVRAIRRTVIEVHEVDPRHVLLVRQATVPLTSSGKVQRSHCRELFDADKIKIKYRYDRASGSEQTPITMPNLPASPRPQDRGSMTTAIETWMTEWLVVAAGARPADVDIEKPFADYGLDSMAAIELSGEIEDWFGVELTPVVAWDHPTVSRLSAFIVDQMIGTAEDEAENSSVSKAEMEFLLDEIEELSDDEINHQLGAKRRS